MFNGIPNDFFSWLEVPGFVKTNDLIEENGESSTIQEISTPDNNETEETAVNKKDDEPHTDISEEKLGNIKNPESKQEIPISSYIQNPDYNENNDDINNGSLSNSSGSNGNEEFSEELEQMLVTGAKSLGSFLFNTASSAVRIVSETSTRMKESIEESLIFKEFNKEQDVFQQKNASHQLESALPWDNCTDGEIIRKACLDLSKEQRNFLHDPPPNSDFKFDYRTSYPVAMAIMDQDPCLEMMRYELVPKKIKEETFWRNYFYRVNLIRKDALENPLGSSTSKDYKQMRMSEENDDKNDETKSTDFDWVTEIDNEISTYEEEGETVKNSHLEKEIDSILHEIDNFP